MFAQNQLQLNSNGNVLLGNPWPGNDPTNLASIQCFGLNTNNYRPGSLISFGDFGAPYSMNAFIGEYAGYDSDALQFHGNHGIHFTSGYSANSIYEIAFLDASGNLTTKGTILGNQTLTYSDERLKKNIKPFGAGLAYIKQLSAISYNYKTDDDETLLTKVNASNPSTTKEIASKNLLQKTLSTKINNPDPQVGFSAQEVQKVLPQLVKADDKGILALNYTGIIPILVEAIKEQQTIIDGLKADIELLKKK